MEEDKTDGGVIRVGVCWCMLVMKKLVMERALWRIADATQGDTGVCV